MQTTHAVECGKYIRLFDLLMVGFEEARELAFTGRADEAAELLYEKLLEKLRARQPLPLHGDATQDAKDADDLLQNRVRLLNGAPEDVGCPVDWHHHIKEHSQWTAHLGYFYRFNALARRYHATGDERYAEKWFQYVEDFIDRMPYGTPELTYFPSRPMVLNDRKTCDNGESDHSSPAHWISLSAHQRLEAWIDGLILLSRSKALTPVRLFRMLESLNGDHYYCLVGNPRANTPNQYIATSFSLLMLGLTFPELKNGSSAFLLGLSRVEDAIDSQMLKDGSDLEQSPNYNTNLLRMVERALSALKDAPESRRKHFDRAARRRLLFLLNVCTPDLHFIDIAKTHAAHSMAPDLLKFSRLFKVPHVAWVASRGSEGAPPNFLNCALNYGGYYVFRSDWTDQARFLLMKASPRGQGHLAEDCCALAVCAFSRNLIVFTGNYSYSDGTAVDRAMRLYSPCSVSHATVLVDGEGQQRTGLWRKTVPDRQICDLPEFHAKDFRPLPNRALDGSAFAYAEGFYDDGYGPGNALQVRHERKVLDVKGRGWLVIDVLRDTWCPGAEHAYTQVWPLAPDFAAEEVCADGGKVETCSAGPNLTLVPIVPSTFVVELHRAEEDPARGWYVREYQERVPKTDVHVRWTGKGVQVVGTWIQPRASGEAAGCVKVSTASPPAEGSLQASISFADGAVLDFCWAQEGADVLELGPCELSARLRTAQGVTAFSLRKAGGDDAAVEVSGSGRAVTVGRMYSLE